MRKVDSGSSLSIPYPQSALWRRHLRHSRVYRLSAFRIDARRVVRRARQFFRPPSGLLFALRRTRRMRRRIGRRVLPDHLLSSLR